MDVSRRDIDFVIPWVDGNDPAWRQEKRQYLSNDCSRIDIGIERYRDWGNLHYWFRAVEKYAPWVRRVYFLTWGHVPEWLNTENPKLQIVNHKDYIPDMYLPTFSSHPIELNIHRIKGLSEQFVYFNDDMFLNAPVKKSDFFLEGLPCDSLAEQPIEFPVQELYNHIRVNDTVFMNQHFERKVVRRKYWYKWYSLYSPHDSVKNILMGFLINQYFFGMDTHHLPQAYLKKTLEEVWEADEQLLHETCTHRFRDERDISQYVFKYWQLLSGEFKPYNKRKFGKPFQAGAQTELIVQAIQSQRYKAICINDSMVADFDKTKQQINQAFQDIFAGKIKF